MSQTDPATAAPTLADRIGHSFADPALLEVSMCHRSWCAENPGGASNERLEFLGDAILGAVVAEELYLAFPDRDEGWLSRARATVVRATTLAEVAEELGLGDELRLGRGEEATGGREKPSILSDAVEAVIGAVHLDGGRDASRRVVLHLLGDRLRNASGDPGNLDDKSRLQEHASRTLRQVVSYAVADSGPEHDKTFTASAVIGGRTWGTGTGRSKKQAEQLAARAAYAALSAADDPSGDGDPSAGDDLPDDGAHPADGGPTTTPADDASAPTDEADDA